MAAWHCKFNAYHEKPMSKWNLLLHHFRLDSYISLLYFCLTEWTSFITFFEILNKQIAVSFSVFLIITTISICEAGGLHVINSRMLSYGVDCLAFIVLFKAAFLKMYCWLFSCQNSQCLKLPIQVRCDNARMVKRERASHKFLHRST